MKSIIKFAAALSLAFFYGSSTHASQAAPALSGKITELQYLLGSWNCTTSVGPYGGMPASSETSTATYEVADGNTLRVRYHNPQYEAEGYMGWNASSKRWWSDGADRYGTVYALNGVETAPDVQVLTGTTWSRHGASPSKDTYTKISDTAYRDVTEAKGPKGMLKIQAACTKNSGGAM